MTLTQMRHALAGTRDTVAHEVLMNGLLFLTVRVIHVLLGAMWVGTAFFTAVFLAPTADDLGPVGGQLITALVRRGMFTVIAAVAGITVLSGFWLYWRFTGGFDPVVSASAGGMAFGVGGVIGLIAAIIGGSVIGRGAKQIATLAGQSASLPEGPDRAARMQTVAALRGRVTGAGRIVLVLLVISIVLMALGHYI